MELLQNISESLQKGDHLAVAELTNEAIKQDLSPKVILDDGLIAGMTVVGDLFKRHKIFLPHVLLAAKAMYAGLDLIKPLMIKSGIKTVGKVVIGSVKGDLHDIGKNLVGIMLKGAGFDVIDLGNDVSPENFVETARREKANAIGMSALLTTTMPGMKDVVDLLKKEGLYGIIKVVVGGAALTEEFAREIGADAYAYDGIKAVETIKSFIGDA